MTQAKCTIADHIKAILSLLGEDPDRPGLADTPQRAEAALRYLTKGYQTDVDTLVQSAVFPSEMDEMVILKKIELYSICEHHLLPFFGKCHIAYIPNGKLLGLSKIARIVDTFARRLQLQEQLTQQIADCLFTTAEASGVAVVIEAQHLCMMMRGVEKQNACMTTSKMLGAFRRSARTRSEFLTLIQE